MLPIALARDAPFSDVWSRFFMIQMIILVGDWNAILDLEIDKAWRGAREFDRCEIGLIDLVDRFRVDRPETEMWTWLDCSPSVRIRTYLDRVLGELIQNSLDVPG